MNWEDSPRILSAPVGLHWAGWRSNTRTLQQCGWQLSTTMDEYDRTLTILLKHPEMAIYGMSDKIDNRGGHLWHPEAIRSLELNCRLGSDLGRPFGTDNRIYETNLSLSGAIPIDATPVYTEQKITSIRDLNIFRAIPPERDVQSFNIEKATMSEVLDFALSKQKPRQDEIRRELLKREHMKGIREDSQIVAEIRMVA